jgi:hypothetical protein
VANEEGPVSTLVLDAAKFTCWRCNGTKFYISTTLDDFNDISRDTAVTAYYVTITGGNIESEIYLCAHCGAENAGNFWIYDVIAGAAGAAFTMTNLDASVADGLAGCYLVYLDNDGTDEGLYYTIASNTAAAPTVITTTVASNNDEVGGAFITRFKPIGMTAAS